MKISIIIPCHNEEKGIGKVIDNIPFTGLKKLGYDIEVIIIDNNSTDRTAEVAKEKNVRVVFEKTTGKGNAIKVGFNTVSHDTDYVIMLDGDNTYSSSEIPRLIEPLASNFCDVIMGSRIGGKVNKGSFKYSNRAANWFYTFLVRQIYRANTTDVLSGYFGWKREVVEKIRPYIETNGFSVEMEMVIKIVKLGYQIYSVPITYNRREGKSKLKPVADGIKIFYVFLKNLFWFPKNNRRINNFDSFTLKTGQK